MAGGPSIGRESQCVVVARGEPGTSEAGGPMAGWFHWVDWRKVVLEPPLVWDGRQDARKGHQGNQGVLLPAACVCLCVPARRMAGGSARRQVSNTSLAAGWPFGWAVRVAPNDRSRRDD